MQKRAYSPDYSFHVPCKLCWQLIKWTECVQISVTWMKRNGKRISHRIKRRRCFHVLLLVIWSLA